MTAIAEEIPTEYVVDELGFKINPESGEVLGHVRDDQKEPFTIDTFEKVDWALQTLTEIDVEIERLNTDPEVAALRARLKALEQNLGALRQRQERRRAYLLFRWQADLKRFTEANLVKGKRSIQRRCGVLKLRAVNERQIQILDPEQAFLWAVQNNRLEVLKREFYLSAFQPTDDLPDNAFKIIPPHTEFSVVTNVGSKAK